MINAIINCFFNETKNLRKKMEDDSSDTEQINYKEFIKKKENNPINRKYEELLKQTESFINNTKNKNINEILSYSIISFFDLILKINNRKINILENKLSMLFHKLHQLSFFNLMMTYTNFIIKISKKIESEKNNCQFNPSKDLLIKAIYDIFLNQNLEHKIFSIKMTSNSELKFNYMKLKLEEFVYNNTEPFFEYNLIPGPYPDGYEIIVNNRDNYLILNDESNKKDDIKKMKDIFRKFGINDRYINWWKNNSYSRQNQNYEIIEEKDNHKIKIENINNEKKVNIIVEQNKEKFKEITKNLIKQENNIKNNFKLTNRNFSNFKNSFYDLKKIILSIPNLTYKIKDIYPYGSISQLTQNINSDYEISIITENYSLIKKSDIELLLKEISSFIELNNNNEYKIEGIRTTKRTFLLILKDIKYKINIEININNIFSILNSNLIYKYVTYDARALILVNTIKDWSKIKGINSNYKGFLSSYCYTLMTIFFLQRIENPLLPIIHSNLNYNKIFIFDKEYFIEKNMLCPEISFNNFKTKNKEDTVTTLLLKFFVFYLFLFNENDYCIDIGNDKLTFRYNEAKYLNYFEERNKISVYCFIDMFDYTYNPGSYMDRDSTPHKLYIKKLQKSLRQLLNGEDNILKPDYEDKEETEES